MFSIERYRRSDLSAHRLASLTGASVITVHRWIKGEAQPQARFHESLRKLGLIGEDVSVRACLDGIRNREEKAVSNAIRAARACFAKEYQDLQARCPHKSTQVIADISNQGLSYQTVCSDCNARVEE